MHPILKLYFPIVDMIAGSFGPACEVVVHDLSQPKNSVVYVANGTVTGRQVGQSFDHLVKLVLLNKQFQNDRMINYRFDLPDGKKIKSSSALIRDEQGEVIGMLCINIDLTASLALKKTLDGFLDTSQTGEIPLAPEQEPGQDVMSILDQLIAKIIGTADVENLSRKKLSLIHI